MGTSLDMLTYLRLREMQMPVYKRNSPQMGQRRYLVDWISLMSNRFSLSSQTTHLAVRIMDYFMDSHNIDAAQLQFVAMACTLLAAKFEETDEKVPRLSKVRPFLSGNYDRASFVSLELMIFRHFDFNLSLPTAHVFCDALLPFSLLPSDYFCGAAIVDFKAVRTRFTEFVKYFLDISLQNSELVEEKSLSVACSVLFCARHALCLMPSWPPALQILTGFRRSDEFFYISRQLMDVYNQQVIYSSTAITEGANASAQQASIHQRQQEVQQQPLLQKPQQQKPQQQQQQPHQQQRQQQQQNQQLQQQQQQNQQQQQQQQQPATIVGRHLKERTGISLPPKKKIRVTVTSLDEGYVSGFNVSPVDNASSNDIQILYQSEVNNKTNGSINSGLRMFKPDSFVLAGN